MQPNIHGRLKALELKIRNTDTPVNEKWGYMIEHRRYMEDLLMELCHQRCDKNLWEIEQYKKKTDQYLESNLRQIFTELQNLAVLLEKANNGELPPSQMIEELAARIQALEKTVATMRARMS